MEEHQQISRASLVPTISPWFVAEDDDTQTHFFFNLHDPLSHYHFKFPELVRKRIRGCFFGCWALLSSIYPVDVMWSLWNPFTSQIIHFPPLILQKSEEDHGDIIFCCCLSAPPDHPDSVLLLTRRKKETFVYCSLGSYRRKELRWTEMSYAEQIKSITGFHGRLHSLTCCNDKLYAYIDRINNTMRILLVEVDVMVEYHKRKKRIKLSSGNSEDSQGAVVITLLPISEFPLIKPADYCSNVCTLKGSCTELFTIQIGYKENIGRTIGSVSVFKLDMDNKTWKEIDDLKDTMFTMELLTDSSPELHSSAIASSEFGGYIHIFCDKGKILHSYHVKDKTFSVSSGPCLAGSNHLSVWEMPECTRLKDAHAQIVERSVKCDHEVNFYITEDDSHLLLPPYGYKCRLESDHAESQQEKVMHNDIIVRPVNGDEDELHLLDIPLHVLEVVMEFCVGVEYLKFRSTCKLCHSAAPLIQCNNGKASKRLQTYSLLSPLLMVFDKHRGVMTFTDPMFGDKYFIKTPLQLLCDIKIKCARYGWLLISKNDYSLVFFNPFTNDIRELPQVGYVHNLCFSAPPTSPNCMVVGLTVRHVFIYFVSGKQSWRHLILDIDPKKKSSHRTLTLYGHDLFAMRSDGGLDIYKERGREDFCWEHTGPGPTSCCTSIPQSYQVRCDDHLLQVIVGKYGESVEVFQLKGSTQEWVKMNGLGKHMIFCGASSLCVEARIPEMENKIYFPRVSSKSGNMVFYSLETCRYHTFDNKVIQEEFADFLGTKEFFNPHWIEPTSC